VRSPFARRFRSETRTSTLVALRALARRLSLLSASSTSAVAAVDEVRGRGFSVWAVPTSERLAERLQGSVTGPQAGQFLLSSGVLGERPFAQASGMPASSPWSAMAFWDGTSFRGILVWLWTGERMTSTGDLISDLPVTSPAGMFTPQLPDNEFRRVEPIVISPAGTVVLSGTANTGFNFSSAQQAGPGGSFSLSFFSADDGVWGILPGRGVDGDTPGSALSTGAYGFNNYNSGEPISEFFWGGPAEASSNAVAVVFSA
jgi:hypothetical protein